MDEFMQEAFLSASQGKSVAVGNEHGYFHIRAITPETSQGLAFDELYMDECPVNKEGTEYVVVTSRTRNIPIR